MFDFSPVLAAPILGFAGSILGVVIAPLFTWRISRGQRLFERKLAVYEQIFGEIHQIRFTADIKLDEIRRGEDGPDSAAIKKEFNEARDRLMKLAHSAAYLFPGEFLDAVRKINHDIFNAGAPGPERYFTNAVTATNNGRVELTRLAKSELGIRHSRKLLSLFKLPGQ